MQEFMNNSRRTNAGIISSCRKKREHMNRPAYSIDFVTSTSKIAVKQIFELCLDKQKKIISIALDSENINLKLIGRYTHSSV